MSIVIDPMLHDQFKEVAAANGKSMNKIVVEFIKRYVEQNLPKLKKGGRK